MLDHSRTSYLATNFAHEPGFPKPREDMIERRSDERATLAPSVFAFPARTSQLADYRLRTSFLEKAQRLSCGFECCSKLKGMTVE
jgi:hypothetical protein